MHSVPSQTVPVRALFCYKAESEAHDMQILYSDILPMGKDPAEKTITESLTEQFHKADRVVIAVGYVSYDALLELDRIVTERNLSVTLLIGMYYYDGMPERSYHTAVDISRRWEEKKLGEIRIVNVFKYHGKLYCFYKNGKPVSAVIGSANLGVLKPDASTLRQYELACITDDEAKCRELDAFTNKLAEYSVRISDADLPLIKEKNTALEGVEHVRQLTETDVELFSKAKTDISFKLPIHAPAYKDRMLDDGKHYTKSNINVCYAAPRDKKHAKARNWFESQFTVEKKITQLPGYPEHKKPFLVVTDDGYLFKAHTTSDGNKQLAAVDDEKIMGYWIKGRIAAAGLVEPCDNPLADKDRKSMITQEMLQAYGRNELILTKTSKQAVDEAGNRLDVWMLSFESDRK